MARRSSLLLHQDMIQVRLGSESRYRFGVKIDAGVEFRVYGSALSNQ